MELSAVVFASSNNSTDRAPSAVRLLVVPIEGSP
jgi:hypothetical protein